MKEIIWNYSRNEENIRFIVQVFYILDLADDKTDELAYLHLRLESHSKKKLGLFLFIIKPLFLKDWAMPHL